MPNFSKVEDASFSGFEKLLNQRFPYFLVRSRKSVKNNVGAQENSAKHETGDFPFLSLQVCFWATHISVGLFVFDTKEDNRKDSRSKSFEMLHQRMKNSSKFSL